ncbi:MAG TPA: hypothetical protein VFZ65_20415 [Planctomycetota bacterium]|nr:hypothetical protein [Planctomycetota bacterium]
MDTRNVVGVVCLMAGLGAQELVPAVAGQPLDLAALATSLDEEALPSVRALIPAEVLARWDALAARLAPADVEPVAQFAESESLRLAAAARILDQPDTERATAAGLLREVRACRWFESAATGRDRTLFGMKYPARYEWLPSLHDAAHRRARGLGARLLREHPDDPAVGSLLLIFADELAGQPAARVRADALRRLGADATSLQFADCAYDSLEDLDLEAAESAFAAMASARPPATVAGRRRAAVRRFDLRSRLADAKAQVEPGKKAGLEGQIAHLRLLQAANDKAAVELSRTLVAAEVPHALPYSILAQDACKRDQLDEAASYLDRTAALPGRDALTFAATFWSRLSPMWRTRPNTPEALERLKANFVEALDRADHMLAGDDSEEAVVLAWFRNELAWPLPGWEGTLGRSLAAAVSLQRELPGSLSAYQTVLAAVLFAEDEVAAREVLLRPIPAALAELDEVALLRATIFVQGLLAADRAPVASELDKVLGDLERAQQDGRDAAYLRGVLDWSDATRPGAGSDAKRAAREHFVAAQRGPAEAGVWPAACALFVADLGLGAPCDPGDLMRQRQLVDPDNDSDPGVSLLALVLASDDAGAKMLEQVEARVDASESDSEQAVLHSASVVGRAARGDLEGSRRAAKRALQAIAKRSAPALPHDRGVRFEGRFALTVGFRGTRPRLDVALRGAFWIVPALPSRAQLEQVAGK